MADEPQVDPRDAEIERLKAEAAAYKPLDDIRQALEEDPAKYFAVREALSGNFRQQQQAPAQQGMTQAQIDQLNEQAREKPAETFAAIASLIAKQQLGDFVTSLTPAFETAADNMIETFKNRKAADDPYYKQVLPFFEKELRDLRLTDAMNMPAATRRRNLELRWDAAANAAFRKAAASSSGGAAPNMGQGTTATQTPPAKRRALDKDSFVRELTQHLIDTGAISAEDAERMNSQLENEGDDE
jgi:hypothetical protein